MKSLKTLLVLATVLSNVSMAYAQGSVAVMSGSVGKVLVNSGKGFAPVSGMVSLSVGDTVMVGKDSSASISYNTGCTVNAGASSVVSVLEKAPCAKGQALLTSDQMFVTAAADVDPVAGPAPFLPLPILLVGGAAATVGILVAAGAFKKKNKNCGVSGCA
jgi:hypothetical protein